MYGCVWFMIDEFYYMDMKYINGTETVVQTRIRPKNLLLARIVILSHKIIKTKTFTNYEDNFRS